MGNELWTMSGPEWRMTEVGFDRKRVRLVETLFTLANGYAGVRASPEMCPQVGDPGFYAAGVYDRVHGFAHEIVNLPCWLGLRANMDGFDFDLSRGHVLECRRDLDMRQGLLFTRITWEDDAKRRTRWESVRLLHKSRRHLGMIWGRITALDYSGTLHLGSRLDAWAVKHSSPSGATRYGRVGVRDLGEMGVGLDVTTRGTRIRVALASRLDLAGQPAQRSVQTDDDQITESFRVPLQRGVPMAFEKRVACYTSRDGRDPVALASEELGRLTRRPRAVLVREHAAAWSRTWAASDIRIEGDPRAQKGIRFSLFHLASLANPGDDRASLGAKGLHGNGYSGLVFWDTEIYLLPFFAHTDPATAGALLRYRHRFLSDARANAASIQMNGARFPWNSSVTGREHLWAGWQEHVSPDIAYAVDQYVRASGDRAFYLHYGAPLIVETAAYWPGRVAWDEARGSYVLRNLCGPDEIHTRIDNNMFTNHLVAWHLRRAAEAVEDLRRAGRWASLARRLKLDDDAPAKWRDIAGRMADTFDARRGFHEQFDGYFRLKERAVDRSMTKMQYTGPVQHSFKPTQVLQQADTVLMYHLFREDFAEAVRRKGFLYYEPRCSHTSTLSRSVFAAVAAQAGLAREAYRLFIASLETDYGPTAECDSGIHAACLGGNWQAVIMGFAGLAARDDRPTFRPRLPRHWKSLSFHLRWRRRILAVRIVGDRVTVRVVRGGKGRRDI